MRPRLRSPPKTLSRPRICLSVNFFRPVIYVFLGGQGRHYRSTTGIVTQSAAFFATQPLILLDHVFQNLVVTQCAKFRTQPLYVGHVFSECSINTNYSGFSRPLAAKLSVTLFGVLEIVLIRFANPSQSALIVAISPLGTLGLSRTLLRMASGLGLIGLMLIRVDSVVDSPDFRPRFVWLLQAPLGAADLPKSSSIVFLLVNCISIGLGWIPFLDRAMSKEVGSIALTFLPS